MNISGFSGEQLAGQRLMVGFDGTELSDGLKSLIDTVKVGGVILFAGNVKTPGQIKNLCESIQDYARSCGQPPLIIAIDQEGGQVARLKEPFTQFPGNPAIKSEEDASVFAAITASELLGVGINMNMAPVMDIAPEGAGSVMSGRVFGSDPHWVSKMGVVVIEGLQAKKVNGCCKAFSRHRQERFLILTLISRRLMPDPVNWNLLTLYLLRPQYGMMLPESCSPTFFIRKLTVSGRQAFRKK